MTCGVRFLADSVFFSIIINNSNLLQKLVYICDLNKSAKKNHFSNIYYVYITKTNRDTKKNAYYIVPKRENNMTITGSSPDKNPRTTRLKNNKNKFFLLFKEHIDYFRIIFAPFLEKIHFFRY